MRPAHDRARAAAELLRRSGGEIESMVQGRSMGRTLPAGTRIRIGQSRDAALAPGAVIAFLAGETLTGHRLVGRIRDLRGREALLTRGDGCTLCDPPIEPTLVVGEVVAWQSATGWSPVPPEARRGPVRATLAAVALTCVRALARLDLPFATVLHESLLTVATRARTKLSRLLKTDG
jgi:uncharacterized protein YceK